MALFDSYGREINQVLFEGNSRVKKVILNRPSKLNSISDAMISEMSKKLKEYENDSAVKLVILKGNRKAFSSGGDLDEFRKYISESHWPFAAISYKKMLTLTYFLATYKKPLVALMDGIVMGAGAGLSMYAPYRIVTEKTVFAMPEVAIGLFPDVGASHFLSRIQGFFGEYLGLTGAKLDGSAMITCGLATHFVLSQDLQLLEDALEKQICTADTTNISQLIGKFSHQTNMKRDNVYYNRLKIVNKCFSRETVEDILLALEEEAKNGEQKWIVNAINSIKSACPASLKIFLRTTREARSQSLDQCLVRDHIVVSHILRGTVSTDLYEGVTWVLDKKKKPKWQPSKLELVTEEMLNRYFVNVDDDDWEPLQLPPRSNTSITHAATSKL